jgi:hypothetical protein
MIDGVVREVFCGCSIVVPKLFKFFRADVLVFSTYNMHCCMKGVSII